MNDEVRDVIARTKAKKVSAGHLGHCPAHDDKSSSLSIKESATGKLLTHCHAGCTREAVWAALGIEPNGDNGNGSSGRREVAVYHYQSADGTNLFEVVRFEPKQFLQRRRDANGEVVWNLQGIKVVPYRLPELLAADRAGVVFLCEGERDVERLMREGCVATTNPGGAGKWKSGFNAELEGRTVAVLEDNDDAGRKHTETIIASGLPAKAASFKVVRLPGLPEKGDVSDWLDAGGTVIELNQIVTSTPEYSAENEPKPDPFPMYSAADFIELEFPPTRWIIENLLGEGVYIFGGKPKLSKTWAAIDIAIAVASDGLALGHLPVTSGDVLLLGLEDGTKRLQKRLKIALRDGPIPARLTIAGKWPRLDKGGGAKIRKWIEQSENPALVIVDTLKKVRPSDDLRKRLYDLDYDPVKYLSDLFTSASVCGLIIHHTRKNAADDDIDLLSGSTGLTGAADGLWVLKRARGECDAVLSVSGKDVEDQQIAMRWDKDIYQWNVLDGDASKYQMSDGRRQVIDLLQNSVPLTPKKVSEALGRSYATVKKLLFDMRQAGLVHSDSKGCYSLPGTTSNPVTATADDGTQQPAPAAALPDDVLYFPAGASDEEIDRIYQRSVRSA
jgi:hypothetical protein